MSFVRLIKHLEKRQHPIYTFLDYHDTDWKSIVPLTRSPFTVWESSYMKLEMRSWTPTAPIFEENSYMIFSKLLQGKASVDVKKIGKQNIMYNILPHPYFVIIPVHCMWRLSLQEQSITLHLTKKD